MATLPKSLFRQVAALMPIGEQNPTYPSFLSAQLIRMEERLLRMIRGEDRKKARVAKQIAAAKETVQPRFDPAAFFQTVGQGRSIST
jgi:hypothetical protein